MSPPDGAEPAVRPDVDPDRFATSRATVADGFALAYVREGVGGFPIVLLHGYPETKRIWWRNVAPLVDAGYEVIVPDLRGFGDSDLAPDEFYDAAAMAHDVHTLLADHLGHDQCATASGDLGGVVAQDMALRWPGFVKKQCLFNTVLPFIPDAYAAAGIPPDPSRAHRPTADYFLRQGGDAEGLIAELDTPERRRRYIAEFYGHRLWAAPGSFTSEDVAFMTEPFADRDKLCASWGAYEGATGKRALSEPLRLFETNPVPTLALYGPEDRVVWNNFPDKCAVAFTECIGPFVVAGAGHFLQWEQAGILNRALAHFFAELR